MSNRKEILSILLAGMLALGMTGCGGKQTEPSATAAAVEESIKETIEETTQETVQQETAQELQSAAPEVKKETVNISLAYKDIQDSYTPEELQKLATRYYFYATDEQVYTLNGYGMNVSNQKLVRFNEIKDAITGEVAYYTAQYREYSKNNSDYYNKTTVYSRLYSKDGKLLRDWEETVYEDAVGQWITTHSYYDILEGEGVEDATGCMLNLKTGETRDGCFYLTEMDGDYAQIMDLQYNMIGVVNKTGKILAGIPIQAKEVPGEPYYSTYKDYITVSDYSAWEDHQLWVYNLKMKPLGYAPAIGDYSLYSDAILGSYICVDNVIYDPTTGTGGAFAPIFQAAEISYFDGELAICDTDGEDGVSSYCLYDVKNGRALTDSYQEILVPSTDGYSIPQEKSTVFYATDGDNVCKINRKGKILASCQVSDVHNLRVYPDGIVCCNSDWSQSCLLDMDLNLKIPYGTYQSLSRANDAADDPDAEPLWTTYYQISGYRTMYSIITSEGEVIMDGLSDVSRTTDGMFSVKRGLYYGIVDRDGNWLIKIPRAELENSD